MFCKASLYPSLLHIHSFQKECVSLLKERNKIIPLVSKPYFIQSSVLHFGWKCQRLLNWKQPTATKRFHITLPIPCSPCYARPNLLSSKKFQKYYRVFFSFGQDNIALLGYFSNTHFCKSKQHPLETFIQPAKSPKKSFSCDSNNASLQILLLLLFASVCSSKHAFICTIYPSTYIILHTAWLGNCCAKFREWNLEG